jgi:hypothetical protein
LGCKLYRCHSLIVDGDEQFIVPVAILKAFLRRSPPCFLRPWSRPVSSYFGLMTAQAMRSPAPPTG